MDGNGTKVLPKQLSPLPPNRIFPESINSENQQLIDKGFHSEGPNLKEFEGTKRSDCALLVKDQISAVTKRPEKTLEGVVQRWNQEKGHYEGEYFISFNYQYQQLALHEGESREGKVIGQFLFPNGAEYRFTTNSDEKRLIITDKNGQKISLIIQDKQLYEDILMKWYSSTKLISDFKRKPEKKSNDEYKEINYSFIFSPPFSSEFGNVFNEKYMNQFQFYTKVDGKPQIKYAVDFKHHTRPNKMIKSYQQESSKEIEEHMKKRIFSQWSPSRDCSRLYMLSKIKTQDQASSFYLEFYDFNLEQQNIFSCPQRINLLSQLQKPLWIRQLDSIPLSQIDAQVSMIATPFIDNHLAVQYNNHRIDIYEINHDLRTIKCIQILNIQDAEIQSIQFLGSSLLVKSNGFYYEFNIQIKTPHHERKNQQIVTLAKDFIKTNLQNIIHCGIYDIEVFKKHVKILNNISSSNQQLDEIIVKEDILKLLIEQNFIQVDDHTIACLHLPVKDQSNTIQIIEISQNNLVKREIDEDIQLQSPLENQNISDCQFSLLKFKENEYLAFIVAARNQSGQFYQYYRRNENQFVFAFQKLQSDFITLQLIPHLPYVSANGRLFMNCEINHNNNQQELDLQGDVQDQVNVHSQGFEFYQQSFKKYLFTLIEENENFIEKGIQSGQSFYSIEIPQLKTSVIIRQDANISRILIFQSSINSIKQLILKQTMRYVTHQVINRDSSYDVSIILQSKQMSLNEIGIDFDLSGDALAHFNFIMKLKEEQKLNESYLSVDLTLSLLISYQEDFNIDKDYWIRSYSLNQKENLWSEQIMKNASQFSQFIQSVAQNESIRIGQKFSNNFLSIIKKLTNIEVSHCTCVFAFINKIIIFQPDMEDIKIFDDRFTMISIVSLKLKAPLVSITSIMDSGVLECTDSFNNKFPFPIMGKSKDSELYEKQLEKYTKDQYCPMPIQFGLYDGLISWIDLKSQKLLFYLNEEDIKIPRKEYARIEIIDERPHFINEIIKANDERQIDNIIVENDLSLDLLFSYNILKRENFITWIEKQEQELKDQVFDAILKRLENEDINSLPMSLPMLIYNISRDPNKYRTILDVLIEDHEQKLANVIMVTAIKQDKEGYLYNRLGPYLMILRPNDLHLFIESSNFVFKISKSQYKENQIFIDWEVQPISEFDNQGQIQKNFKNFEGELFPTAKKSMDQHKKVPVEYHVINLMQLMQSDEEPIKANHRAVTQTLSRLAYRIDQSIFGIDRIQAIIDFKWNSYAFKILKAQFYLLNCIIIAFIIDIVAVNMNSQVFEIFDKNQVIPRIITFVLIIPLTIIEIAVFKAVNYRYYKYIWSDHKQASLYSMPHIYCHQMNLEALLMIIFYAAYFTISFTYPEQQYVLKVLQVIILVLLSRRFGYLTTIYPSFSFIVHMFNASINDLQNFIIYSLFIIVQFTIWALIIMKETVPQYDGIKPAAYFMIVLREFLGDYDTASIVEGTKDFQILAWILWFLIMLIANIIFMNFLIAVVSETYDRCISNKTQIIYSEKLNRINDIEELMPECLFTKANWFPRFLIFRGPEDSLEEGDNPNEQQGFVNQIKMHMHKTNKNLMEKINDSNDKINELKQILSALKDQIAAMSSQEKIQPNENKGI